MARDVDTDSFGEMRAVQGEVKKLAQKRGVRPPSMDEILELARPLEGGGQQSAGAIAREIFTEWLKELEAASPDPKAYEDIIRYPSNGVGSLVLVVAFKNVVEQFRSEVWSDASLPFQSEDAACVWLELLHRLESKTGDYIDATDVPMFKLHETKSGWQSWRVPSGGIMEKLYKLSKTLAEKSEWWSTDNALKLILLGLVPGSVRVQPGGYGNYTKKITITTYGPTPETEVLRAYRMACESAQVKPRALSHVHHRLLFLVHYLMPTASWPKRYKTWLEWCQSDNGLPKYGGKLRKDGTVEKPGGYRNLKGEYKRAMKRQSWTGETPRLLRPGAEFEKYWAPRRDGFSVKRSPAPAWEEPTFDTLGFEPPQVDLDRLEVICQEATKVNPYPHGMNTFWEYFYSE